MRDLLLQCSGVAAILVALIHGTLGETKVFARATIEPPRLRTLIRLVWQAGTVAWIGGGVLLLAAPWMEFEPGAPLDRRDARARVRLCRLRQCVGDTRTTLWLAVPERRGRTCGRRLLSRSPIDP